MVKILTELPPKEWKEERASKNGCHHCGKPSDPEEKYCNRECKLARTLFNKYFESTFQCHECGERYTKTSTSKGKKFCSEICRHEYRRRLAAEKKETNRRERLSIDRKINPSRIPYYVLNRIVEINRLKDL